MLRLLTCSCSLLSIIKLNDDELKLPTLILIVVARLIEKTSSNVPLRNNHFYLLHNHEAYISLPGVLDIIGGCCRK